MHKDFLYSNEKSEPETCILCGKETGIMKNTPINYRENYVIGSGQLCSLCAEKLAKKRKNFSGSY